MEGLLKLSTLMIVCMLVAGPVMASDAAISWGEVAGNLGQCYNYLTSGGYISRACCAGVQRLNSMARTTSDRQQACRFIQGAAKALGFQLNTRRTARLRRVCRVRVFFPISNKTNCNTVK